MLLNNALAVIERSATVLPELSSDGFKAANAAMVAFWSRQDGRLQSLVRQARQSSKCPVALGAKTLRCEIACDRQRWRT